MNHMTFPMHKASDEIPVSTVLAAIESVMKRAGQITERAAAEHLDAFTQQMREKLGVDEMALNEPYLPALLKEYEVRFLESLEKLFDRIDKNMPEAPAKAAALPAPWPFEYKALRFDKPLLPQIEERLDMETIRYTRHLKQGLDGVRQQAAGIVKYIWRTVGDERVRPSHALNDGKIFTWGDGEDPGEAFGCRCSGEPILEDAGQPIIQANPLGWTAAIAAAIARRAAILRRAGTRRAERAAEDAAKPKPTPAKPAEAPRSPTKPKPDISKRPNNVPKYWEKKPSDKGEGTKYVDPKNRGNEIRIQKGDPNSKYPNQRGDYVRWKKDGQWLDKNGKPISGPEARKSPDGHIPFEEFNFELEIFK